MKHAAITVAVDVVGSARQKARGMQPPGGKANPLQIYRSSIRLVVFGIVVVAIFCAVLVGWGDVINSRRSSSFVGPAVIAIAEEEAADSPQCNGRRVFMYDLPPQFNEDIVQKFCEEKNLWLEMCESYINEGLGLRMEHVMDPLEAWYRTEQFAVEVMVHERVKTYPCLTKKADTADLFYLPYYVGLDVTRYLFATEIQLRDLLSERFLGWLMAQPSWNRMRGNKHFMVLGRIIWDFNRKVQNVDWGNSLLNAPEFGNVTKLLLERDPQTVDNQVGIPYPTSFHPESDSELQLWQQKVANSKRDVLVSFAGAPRNRTKHPEAALRDILFEQCTKSELCSPLLCNEVNCPKNPHYVTNLFLHSTFCFQPPGDSPTRKAVFDCLVAGSIPVFFTRHTAHTQYLWHLPADGSSYSVMFDEGDVIESEMNVIEVLAKIPEARVERMQAVIVEKILPSIVYDMPGRDPGKKVKDAFDIILESLLVPEYEAYPTLTRRNRRDGGGEDGEGIPHRARGTPPY